MTTYAAIEALLKPHHLAIMGGFDATAGAELPKNAKALLLLGPEEPGFWPHLTMQPEWQDGAPDPVDRWSRRVIEGLAKSLAATALFPFGGPPWQPFYSWSLASGRAWDSPVRLLVHDKMGLFASYRGALALTEHLDLPSTPPKPCDSCVGRRCLTACPAAALTGAGYDLSLCHTYLDSPAGGDCMKNGCASRRACPVSQAYARLPEQSAYHMRQFHK